MVAWETEGEGEGERGRGEEGRGGEGKRGRGGRESGRERGRAGEMETRCGRACKQGRD